MRFLDDVCKYAIHSSEPLPRIIIKKKKLEKWQCGLKYWYFPLIIIMFRSHACLIILTDI